MKQRDEILAGIISSSPGTVLSAFEDTIKELKLEPTKEVAAKVKFRSNLVDANKHKKVKLAKNFMTALEELQVLVNFDADPKLSAIIAQVETIIASEPQPSPMLG